ncbi:MAG: permease [Flavobacteriales bacterium]|nr:permease [Flavobacteriales bacterium]
MLKTFSKFILKSFASPFFATFFIALFVLLMQFVWKYIDDMVGKGLEWTVIVELLIYVSASLVPMALPLSILLSSIMTMGNLGENYELVAFKSAGISLKRILRPLAVVAFLLSILAFVFSNYLLPIANLKSKSLLYDVKEQKPTMDIQPGIFSNSLDDYSIRVRDKKVIDDVEHLYDVLIYDHTSGDGNRVVIVAQEGIMTVSDNNNQVMNLKLIDGYSYDESEDNQKRDFPHMRSKFGEQLIRFDLSQFTLNRTDEDLFKSNYKMLNMEQLDDAIDTLSKLQSSHFKSFKSGFKKSSIFYNNKKEKKELISVNRSVDFDSLYNNLPFNKQKQVLVTATNLSRNAKSRLSSIVEDMYNRTKYINYHKIQWHQKLTLSFACLVLFLIGAPLGAIIRKGGLGMPIVISVIFFLIFHILSITGEKMSKEGAMPVVQGMWMASMILLPVGLFFTYKATTDSSFFRLDSYFDSLKKLFRKKSDQTKEEV